MTKTLKSTLNRYNENFPARSTGSLCDERYSPLSTRRRVSCPPSPVLLSRISIDHNSNLNKSSTVESPNRHRKNSTGPVVPCLLKIPKSPINSKKIFNSVIISGACDSRRSSGASSIPEVITECESDEECENDNSLDSDSDFDYIRCINCSRSKSTSSLDSKSTSEHHLPGQQIVNYCYNCRHLLNQNHHHLPAFYEGRRSSWTAGDSLGSNYSPRNSRRSSLATSSCTELPMISEPSFDEETNDTFELKRKVEEEVDKLTKLNNRKNKLHQKKEIKEILQNDEQEEQTKVFEEKDGFLPEVDNKNCESLLVAMKETNL